MAGKSIVMELQLTAAANRVWGAYVKDGHNCLLKIFPHIFASIFVEGDGGVGTIRVFTYIDDNKNSIKDRVEEIDEENFVCRYSLEGGRLGQLFSCAKQEEKWIPKQGGGCVCASTFHYEKLPACTADEEGPILAEINRSFHSLMKAIDSYLVSNPALYT